MRVDKSSIVLGELIDEGRFGEVYHATWEGKSVAVKRIKKIETNRVQDITKEIKINGYLFQT